MNDVLARLVSLLSTAMTTRCNKYYQGRVDVPPKSYLPILMVYNGGSTFTPKQTNQDLVEYDVRIRVIVHMMDHVDEDGTDTIIKATRELGNIMEERNADRSLKSNTVLGVLRANIRDTAGNWLFDSNMSVDYYPTPFRNTFFYVAAEVSVKVTELITR